MLITKRRCVLKGNILDDLGLNPFEYAWGGAWCRIVRCCKGGKVKVKFEDGTVRTLVRGALKTTDSGRKDKK